MTTALAGPVRRPTISALAAHAGVSATATRALLARDERPTAIVYDSDVAALAGVTVLTEAGLDVPGDISPIPELTVRGSTGRGREGAA